MFVRIWRYRVRPGRETEFARAYGPDGTWVQLFRSGGDYVGTELLEDVASAGAFVTIDRWTTRDAWSAFHDAHRVAYESLDAACEQLTMLEERLGEYVESGR